MRVLAIDLGARRVGLAISDRSRTLARPLNTLTVSDEADALARVIAEVERLVREEDGLAAVVVGMPSRLDGSATDATRRVEQFVHDLETHVDLPVTTEDERLTSREAESLLAVRERDWRKRKARLDQAAAALILQGYLDKHR